MKLAFAAAVLLIAQTPQLPKPTFETGVDIIQVDVHVVDRSGKPIADLKPEDFEVDISGKKRKISTVQFVSYATPLPGATGPDPAKPAAVAAHRPRRLYLVAVDEHSLHTSNALAGIEAAERFIDRLQPDDLVGLHAFPTGNARHDFTSDHAAVKRALRGVTGLFEESASRFNLAPSEIIDIASGDQDVLMRVWKQRCGNGGCSAKDILTDAMGIIGMMEVKVSQSVGGLRSLVRGLGDIPGRKTVVLVSGGMMTTDRGGGRANAQGEIAALGREVAAANCSLFALHLDWSFLTSLGSKGGLRTSYFRDSNMAATGLEVVAGTAGGAVMRVQGTSPNVAFDRVLSETAAHYLLGVEGTSADRDGEAHPIRVKVKRGGAQVRSRTWVTIPREKPEKPSAPVAVAPSAVEPPAPAAAAPPPPVSSNPPPPVPGDPVDGLLAKAARYLADYERQISAVVLEEDYVQRVIDERAGRRPVARHLRSDVLVITDPVVGWVGFRDVFEVDGHRVRDRNERLAKLFLTPTSEAIDKAQRIVEESSRHNLNPGPGVIVQRSINMPMLALKYVTGENQFRSTFTSLGLKDVAGRPAHLVEFREHGTPRIIRTSDNSPASGRLWIDPETGAVLQTELSLRVKDVETGQKLDSRVNVSFARHEKLALWLPHSMSEEYVTGRITITGDAKYVNPRRFTVATTESIKLP